METDSAASLKIKIYAGVQLLHAGFTFTTCDLPFVTAVEIHKHVADKNRNGAYKGCKVTIKREIVDKENEIYRLVFSKRKV